MTDWQDISTAPRLVNADDDMKWIIAITKANLPSPYEHLSGRAFVIRHMGYRRRSVKVRLNLFIRAGGYDMGWALFPGMGVGDDWLDVWMPLPAPPTPKGGA
jgi:hypothetical protein